jgi:hypothetical protein
LEIRQEYFELEVQWPAVVSTREFSQRSAFFAAASRAEAHVLCHEYSDGNVVRTVDDGLWLKARVFFTSEEHRRQFCSVISIPTIFKLKGDARPVFKGMRKVTVRDTAVRALSWDDYMPTRSSPDKPEDPPQLPCADLDLVEDRPDSETSLGSMESLDQSHPIAKYQFVSDIAQGLKYVKCHLHSRGGSDPCKEADNTDHNNFIASSQDFHSALDGFNVEDSLPLIVLHPVADPIGRRASDNPHLYRVFLAFTGRTPAFFKPGVVPAMVRFPPRTITFANVWFVAVFVPNVTLFTKNAAWKQKDTLRRWEERQINCKPIRAAFKEAERQFKSFCLARPSSTPTAQRVVRRVPRPLQPSQLHPPGHFSRFLFPQ